MPSISSRLESTASAAWYEDTWSHQVVAVGIGRDHLGTEEPPLGLRVARDLIGIPAAVDAIRSSGPDHGVVGDTGDVVCHGREPVATVTGPAVSVRSTTGSKLLPRCWWPRPGSHRTGTRAG